MSQQDIHQSQNWYLFKGVSTTHGINWSDPKYQAPPWRERREEREKENNNTPHRRGEKYIIPQNQREKILNAVNAALILRRPLLVYGPPGTGKSSLAMAVANELQLDEVLQWPITSRTTLKEGLYTYDAIGRLQESSLNERYRNTPPQIGNFIRLGPLGHAFTNSESKPRVLLIDELDKGDIDLPNDLLNLLEEGSFVIPELARFTEVAKTDFTQILYEPYFQELSETTQHKIKDEIRQKLQENLAEISADTSDSKSSRTVTIRDYYSKQIDVNPLRITCETHPFIIMTSNNEREFPPAFLRRCIRLRLEYPSDTELQEIIKKWFGDLDNNEKIKKTIDDLIQKVKARREAGGALANDQLLNAVHLLCSQSDDTLTADMLDFLIDKLN